MIDVKSVGIEENVWKDLMRIKIDGNFSNMNGVIAELIKVYKTRGKKGGGN